MNTDGMMELDFTGTRVAIGGTNGNITIWKKVNNIWKKHNEWKSDSQKLTWAKPCFSSILASSFNNEINLWDEEGTQISHFTVPGRIIQISFAAHEEFLELAVCLEESKICLYRPKDELKMAEWYLNKRIIGQLLKPLNLVLIICLHFVGILQYLKCLLLSSLLQILKAMKIPFKFGLTVRTMINS